MASPPGQVDAPLRWQLRSHVVSKRAGSMPFLGVHLCNSETNACECGDVDGEQVLATSTPTGFVLVCAVCLETAEQAINRWRSI